ncbi:MAG: hypothetical protein HY057_13945 [Rhodospirillales bacterium]|nr:hypothetical protein [Rhodospirillales bacterium]
MKNGGKILIVAFALQGAVIAAQAAETAALVEDIEAKTSEIGPMDYLSVGQVVRLNAGETLVLGYLKSCWRETIAGGTVTVGAEQSTVAGGKVRREKVECDGGRMRLAADQAGKSAAFVTRQPPKPVRPAPEAQVTLYGLSPVVDLKGGGKLVIERLDQPGERIEVEIGAGQLFRGAFYDFAKADKALAAGGVYRASAGNNAPIVFKIDPFAKPGQAPVVGRLLRFQGS